MPVTAKFIANFDSFFAAVQKADDAIVDFGKAAGTVQTKINTFADQFSGRKVIQEATLMAAAVQQVGGFASLSKDQIEKFASVTDQAAGALERLGSDGAAHMRLLATTAKNEVSPALSGLGQEIVGVAAGFISAQAAIGLFKSAMSSVTDVVESSIKAYSESESAQIKLVAALKQHSLATPQVIDQYNELATTFQNTTVFADEQITAMEGLLTQVGGIMPSAMKNALKASTDLAAGLGIDLHSATLLVAKAAAGHTETLGRYGIAVSQAELATKGFDAVLDAINRQFGGQAAAQAETYAGKIEQIKNSFNNVEEAIGKLIVTDPLVELGLRKIADAAKDADRESSNMAVSLVQLGRDFQIIPPQIAEIVEGLEIYANKLNEIERFHRQINSVPSPFEKIAKDLQQSNITADVAQFIQQMKVMDEQRKKEAEEAARNADAQAKYRNEVLKTVEADKNQVAALGVLIPGLVEGTDQFNRVRDAIGGILAKGLVVPDFLKNWYDANKPVLQVSKDFSGVMAAMPNVLSATADSLHNLDGSADEFHNGITVAGNEIASSTIPVFTTLTKGVLPQMSKEIEKAGDTLDKSFGDQASQALGGVIKILHTARNEFTDFAATAAQGAKTIIDSWKNTHSVFDLVINSVTTIGSLFAKLFSDPEKEVNPVREAFVQLNGGLDALNKKAHDAGMTLNAMLNAKTPEAYTAAINALNDAFKFQDDAMKTLDDTIQKYGFSISELGPTFAKQKLDEQAGTLLQDYQVLTAAGIDHVAVIEKMGPALQDYVTQAEKTGTAIPESLRPVLQQMVDLGELTDENGDKLTDLSKLTFAETLDKKFSTLIDTINKLTDAISRGLGTAITNIPQPGKITIPIEYDYTTVGQPPDTNYASRGGYVSSSGIQYMAGGGRVLAWPSRGSDTVPAMLTPGEGVVSKRGMASIGKSGLAAINRGGWSGGGDSVNIVNNFSIAADVDSPAARERVRKVVDQATMAALRRQKRTNVA